MTRSARDRARQGQRRQRIPTRGLDGARKESREFATANDTPDKFRSRGTPGIGRGNGDAA